MRGAGAVKFGLGGHLAARQLGHFFQSGQAGAAFLHGGTGLRQLCLRTGQRGAGAQHLVVEFGGVKLHQHLTFFDPVVHVHQHAQHGARELAADVDRAGGLQRAIGCHGQGQVAFAGGLRDVAGRGTALLALLPIGVAASDGQHQHQRGPQRATAPPGHLARFLQKCLQVTGFGAVGRGDLLRGFCHKVLSVIFITSRRPWP